MQPTTNEFDKIHIALSEVLFELVMAGRANSDVHATAIRWVLEKDKEPYWMLSIYGLGLDDPMALQTIALYLGEEGYDVENIEIVLEAEDDSI